MVVIHKEGIADLENHCHNVRSYGVSLAWQQESIKESPSTIIPFVEETKAIIAFQKHITNSIEHLQSDKSILRKFSELHIDVAKELESKESRMLTILGELSEVMEKMKIPQEALTRAVSYSKSSPDLPTIKLNIILLAEQAYGPILVLTAKLKICSQEIVAILAKFKEQVKQINELFTNSEQIIYAANITSWTQ